ncbi:MAG: ABC transporter ATP-binding protein [Christensenellales bacterium]|jgi:ABC-type lipoprotein export system ATPase subunit
MQEMIKLENVIKMYEDGRRAVNGINLCVRKGECVVICGASGSGKTTLMRLLAGMERPSSGRVMVLGKAVHEMDADRLAAFRNRHIGLLSKDAAFMGGLTVLENVALPLMIRGVSFAKREKAAKEQLKTLGLTYVAGARPAQLSSLETKLVSIARMLIAQPEVLLLHDATASLSARDWQKFWQRLYGRFKRIIATGRSHRADKA